jgi:hypothetical protein
MRHLKHLVLLHYLWKIPLVATVVVGGCLLMAAVGPYEAAVAGLKKAWSRTS